MAEDMCKAMRDVAKQRRQPLVLAQVLVDRPEDIAPIARIRGVSYQQVYEAIRAMADGA